MPLDLTCPKCSHVYPVMEARNAVPVHCPRCEFASTAEFRRVPLPQPGESPYELRVTPGSPKNASSELNADARALSLDDDDEETPEPRGGSMTLVVCVALVALVLMLGGLGLTGYVLFTHLDTSGSSSSSSSSAGRNSTQTGGIANNPNRFGSGPIIPGGGGAGGGFPSPPPPPPQKVDRFNLRPATGTRTRITPPKLDAGGKQEVTLPGRADAMAVGGGGRYLVFHIEQAGKLAVVDVTTASVVAEQAADPGPVKLAAGLNKLAMWAPAERKFRVYALPQLRKLYDADCALFHGPVFMGMGNRTNGPMLAVDPFGEVLLHDIDKPGAPVVEGSQGKPSVHAGHGGGIRVTPDGAVFATFDGFGANHKVVLLREVGGKWSATRDTFPAPFPNAAGSLFYGNGVAMDRNGRSANIGRAATGEWLIPATSGEYFIKLVTAKGPGAKSTSSLTVHSNRNAGATVAGIPPITNLDTEGVFDVWGNPAPLDLHFILVPEAKVLAFIPGTKDRVQFRKVELR